MVYEQIIAFMRCFGQNTSGNSSKWVRFPCPFAPFYHANGTDEHPSFGIEITLGASRYYCFSCQKRGSLIELVDYLRSLYNEEIKNFNFVEAAAMAMYDGALFISMDLLDRHTSTEFTTIPWPDNYLEEFVYDPSFWYLQVRGIDEVVSRKFNFLVDYNQKRIGVPIYDYQKRLTGFHGRAYNDNPLKYYMYEYEGIRNPHIFLGEHWVNYDKPVVVAESVFDAAKIAHVYKNVITPLTASITYKRLDRIKEAITIITAFDNDEAGSKARYIIDRWAKGRIVLHIIPDNKDFGEESVYNIKDKLFSLGIIR